MKRKRLTNETDDHRPKIPYVPEEIFEEILSRLPVKTLMQSKSVAKSWNALISDPRFSISHLKQSAGQNRMRFMYLHDYSQRTLAYEAPDDTSDTNKPIKNTEESDGCVDFLASCNGLFCISNAEDEMFFWNPSTRECKMIPGSKIEFPGLSCTRASAFFGLGYQSPSDDYRLVRISMFDSVEFQTEVKIYSRNNNTWRRIEDFPYDFPIGRSGVLASGNLHWIVSMWSDSVQIYMIAFLNIEDESYGLITLPHLEHDLRFFDIGTLGESLVLFCCNSKFKYEYDIWILKEYGNTETWTRIKITAPCVKNIEAVVYFEPLCLLGPDAILIRIGPKKFAVYDVNRKGCWEFLASDMIKETRIVSFLESLVSPNA